MLALSERHLQSFQRYVKFKSCRVLSAVYKRQASEFANFTFYLSNQRENSISQGCKCALQLDYYENL